MIRYAVMVVVAIYLFGTSIPALVDRAGRKVHIPSAQDDPANNDELRHGNDLQVEQRTSGYQMVTAGETLELSYLLTNISGKAMAYVQIDDPSLYTTPITHMLLEPGCSAEFTFKFSMNALEKHSSPMVTYQFKDDATTYSHPLKPTDFYVKAGLSATLQVDPIVYPGDRVDFRYTIVNATDTAYTDLRITDERLGYIETNIMLNPGETYEGCKSIAINETVTFRLVVTGIAADGSETTILSNEATVQIAERVH